MSFVQLQSVVSVLVRLYTSQWRCGEGTGEKGNIRICFFFMNFAAVGKLSKNCRKMLLAKNANV